MDPLIENPRIIGKYIIRTPQTVALVVKKESFNKFSAFPCLKPYEIWTLWLKPHKLLANISSELLKTMALVVKKE